MKTVERARQLWRDQAGSQGLEAAGAALAAALIVLALLAAAPTTGGAIQRALGCAASVLTGGGGCGGGEGTAQTAPAAGDQPQEPEQEDCGGWCQVGGFFKGVGGAAVDTAKGLWSLGGDVVGLATGDEETREKYGALIDAFQNDPGGTLQELGSAIVAPIVEDWKAGRYGEAIGRGSFEVLSTVIGGKGIDKLGKLGKVDNVVAGAGRYGDEAGDAGRLVPCLGATPGRGRLPGLAAPARGCSEYDRLRRKTPSQAIRDQVNPDGPKQDPIYGFDVDRFEADHIVSMKEITQMPGFDRLTEAEKIEVLNLPDNFIGLSKPSNASKGAKTWRDWRGHSQLGPIPPEVRAEMIKREAQAREALERAIRERAKP